ncbi:zinc ribbon domain-containing protein [uncultured Kordia sp.]|uniref:zinc ribbon domain-containing protein n=1 Tax=uncultured Kordia sp. TaxID=507699 RepID=UPI0026375A9A|nr:zinc ribbon domain-containing protein [uncultured Kordia sp.]
MKNCIACNQPIAAEVKFCPHCGAKQPSQTANIPNTAEQEAQAKPPTIIIILAVLTICGSLFGIGRALLYDLFGSATNDDSIRIRAIIYVVTSVGTILGAVFMLLKQRKGLYIYTVFQVIYIATVIYAASAHSHKDENLSSAMLVFFVVPAILFLILYWLKDIRKHLK